MVWRLGSFFLVLIAGMPAGAMAQADNTDLGKPFAVVWHIKGDVSATSPAGHRRLLAKEVSVTVGEELSASATGEAVLKTSDGGLIAVRPNTRFVVERFSAQGQRDDRQVLRLISGALRIVTGWIGKMNPGGYKISTPTATIGVRGTDHEPYVLPRELATEAYRSGTYDKVNRGGTMVEASGGTLDVAPGKVGFVRDPSPIRTRALMTLLMPILLEKVPDFYVAGSFEREIERYSQVAERESLRALTKQNPQAKLPKLAASATASTSREDQTARVASPPLAALPAGCTPKEIATYWLGRFDGAIQRKDLKAVLAMLAPEITATARVNSGGETMVLEFDRDEMVKSTIASISSVKDYQYRRTSLDAALAEGESDASCRRLTVRSVAIEQGMMNGKPYRAEAQEDYVLERRGDEWLAVKAETTQR